MVIGFPSTSTLNFCKFVPHLLRVALNECERLLPLCGPLPVTGHILDMLRPPNLNAFKIIPRPKITFNVKVLYSENGF